MHKNLLTWLKVWVGWPVRSKMDSCRTKRLFDLGVVIFSSPLAIFLMLFIVAAVYSKLGPPVFFIQTRPGHGAKPFRLYKFRTLTDACDKDGKLLPDSARVTPFGNFLRSTSMDELPELLNILKGEMSFVGPRPLLMEYLPRYTARQARRHEVKPGLTGWAQVNGRNALTWEDRFELDVWYVENKSFKIDLKIIGMTIGVVFKRKGISNEGSATMEKFKGTAQQDKC